MEIREPVELVFATLGPEAEANQVLARLIEMNRSGAIELISATVLAKDESGKVDIQETPDLLKEEAPFQAVLAGSTGGLFARIAGVLAGAMAEAVLDLAASPVKKVGVEEQHLQELAQELAPGTSALLALLEEEDVEPVVHELDPLVLGIRRFVLESDGPGPASGEDR